MIGMFLAGVNENEYLWGHRKYEGINMAEKRPAQGSGGTSAATLDRVRIEEPRQYKVIFHNDDFTTMEFVTEVLRSVFGKPADEAVALMMRVHREGQAMVGIYSYDVAMTKASQAISLARQEGFPLNITCEPE